MSGKLLMFAKLSLKSFIYSFCEIFYFPTPAVKEIYQKYKIERILCYHILTDTDSTSIQHIIISDPKSNFPESKIRDVIFEVITSTDIYIYNHFDTSHPFGKTLMRDKKKEKKSSVCTK